METCTCGTRFVEGARFCHKCGRPRFDEPESQEITADRPLPSEAGPPPPVTLPEEINFHNSLAVRIAFLAALIASFLIAFPLPVVIAFGWMLTALLGAGFFAVYLYSRRTGITLDIRNGVRMGWLTGVFCFVIAMVIFTISIIAISYRTGLTQFYQEQISARAGSDPNLQQVLDVLQSPGGLATVILASMFFLFLLFTLLPVVGGALGAKVLDRD